MPHSGELEGAKMRFAQLLRQACVMASVAEHLRLETVTTEFVTKIADGLVECTNEDLLRWLLDLQRGGCADEAVGADGDWDACPSRGTDTCLSYDKDTRLSHSPVTKTGGGTDTCLFHDANTCLSHGMDPCPSLSRVAGTGVCRGTERCRTIRGVEAMSGGDEERKEEEEAQLVQQVRRQRGAVLGSGFGVRGSGVRGLRVGGLGCRHCCDTTCGMGSWGWV
jgi:hypothetical protein